MYTIRILHAIGDGTQWCTTCNRGRFVYEYDSSLITRDVTGAHKVLSFVNVLYIRFAIDCTNSQGGDCPPFQNVPGLIVECHTYVPGWRRLHTHTHTHTLHFDISKLGGVNIFYLSVFPYFQNYPLGKFRLRAVLACEKDIIQLLETHINHFVFWFLNNHPFCKTIQLCNTKFAFSLIEMQ